MAPRKSTARNARPSHASSIATSSKVTLDSLPPPEVPVSITPDYTPVSRPRTYLDETDKERLVYELVGFYPRKVCDDITKSARDQIDTTIGNIENWAQARAPANDEDAQREMNIGLYAAESLLESRVDKECDKFTAWMLRNPFDFKGDKEYVLPWHAGLDFARGEFVTNLSEGQATLESRLEDLRTQTERARLVSQRLAHAEEAIDRRLEIAKQRKAEVGFVKEVLAASGLSPLDHKAGLIVQNMTQLHTQLSTLEPPSPGATQPVKPDSKAWEMGRRAYLTWAVNKVAPAVGSGEEVIEGVERDMRAAGGSEGVEAIGHAAG